MKWKREAASRILMPLSRSSWICFKENFFRYWDPSGEHLLSLLQTKKVRGGVSVMRNETRYCLTEKMI